MSNPYASSAGNAYRETEILSATPGRLVVLTFDGLLAALARARVGITMGNDDVRIAGFDKARLMLGELLAALDVERGGDIARQLSGLYVFLLSELVTLGVRPDVATLDRITGIVRELRDAFHQIADTPRREVA
ncbi:MAG: flagellar export chaperone FliS [Gemmatimonadetes bacterium]|nr:flagellar export chaperone FliS [Gemmatimonadota bacterium]